MTVEERFWAKVDKRGPDECWPWMAATDGHYGQMNVAGRLQKAHRIAHECAIGPIPQGMHVIHSCDNTLCCNPAHLRAGTAADNMRDMVLRRRSSQQTHPERYQGDTMPRRKLTVSQVLEIRATTAASRPTAMRYGVSVSLVNQIRRGESWKCLLRDQGPEVSK